MATPLDRHRDEVERVLPAAEPSAVKRLYIDLGDDLWRVQSGAGEAMTAPLLSRPETGTAVIDLVGRKGGLVLDAGCGPYPFVALALAELPTRRVIALDIGWGMVRSAVEMAAQQHRHILGIAGDAEHLPFRRGSFDVVVSDDTIEHLPDDSAAVGELARVARRDGRVIVATPNRRRVSVLLRRGRDRIRRRPQPDAAYFAATSHLREYSWGELERLVSPALHLTRRSPVGWGGRAGALTAWLVRLPGLRQLSRTIVIEGEPRK